MTNEQLVELIQAGTDVADNMLRLYQQTAGLIAKIAGDYHGQEDLEDLKQQGYLGLYPAVDGYRAETGVPFASYAAYWIRQEIRRYIENCGSLVRIPSGRQLLMQQYRRFCTSYRAEYAEDPADPVAAAALGISVGRLKRLKEDLCSVGTRSLDAPISEDGETTVGDLLPDRADQIGAVTDQVAADQLHAQLWGVVAELPEAQRKTIEARYRDNMTLKETAVQLGVKSVESVRQHERNALAALHRPTYRKRLLPCLDVYGIGIRGTGVGKFRQTGTSATEAAAFRLLEFDERKQNKQNAI